VTGVITVLVTAGLFVLSSSRRTGSGAVFASLITGSVFAPAVVGHEPVRPREHRSRQPQHRSGELGERLRPSRSAQSKPVIRLIDAAGVDQEQIHETRSGSATNSTSLLTYAAGTGLLVTKSAFTVYG
jgi:hypothetical protein